MQIIWVCLSSRYNTIRISSRRFSFALNLIIINKNGYRLATNLYKITYGIWGMEIKFYWIKNRLKGINKW